MLKGTKLTEMEKLGWTLCEQSCMNGYYAFKRCDEHLYIDTDKQKIIYYNLDEDDLPSLSYETLEIVMKILKENRR